MAPPSHPHTPSSPHTWAAGHTPPHPLHLPPPHCLPLPPHRSRQIPISPPLLPISSAAPELCSGPVSVYNLYPFSLFSFMGHTAFIGPKMVNLSTPSLSLIRTFPKPSSHLWRK